jgi:hypothetical protein
MELDDLKLYLPRFLSENSEKSLFEGLKDFPNNLDGRFYTGKLKNEEIIFQGDGIRDLLVVNLPSTEIKGAKCLVFSNTCDLDPSNPRFFPSQIVYAPIFDLEKYQSRLSTLPEYSSQKVSDHVEAIRRQEITQVFYLPRLGGLLNESIVFLDRINNCSNDFIVRKDLPGQRVFSLGDYGFYIFLLKLSIHFTRIRDKVDRGSLP